MFLHLSVVLFTGRCLADTPWADPPGIHRPPRRYASYLNAFLLGLWSNLAMCLSVQVITFELYELGNFFFTYSCFVILRLSKILDFRVLSHKGSKTNSYAQNKPFGLSGLFSDRP